jgi:hypothetical protein
MEKTAQHQIVDTKLRVGNLQASEDQQNHLN